MFPKKHDAGESLVKLSRFDNDVSMIYTVLGTYEPLVFYITGGKKTLDFLLTEQSLSCTAGYFLSVEFRSSKWTLSRVTPGSILRSNISILCFCESS